MGPTTTAPFPLLAETLLELIPDPMWIIDATGVLAAYNPAFERWWDLVADQTVSRDTDPSSVEPLRLAQRRALEGRSVMIDLHTIVEGTERTYAVDARPLFDGELTAGAAFIARELPESSAIGDAAIELSLSNIFSSPDEELDAIMEKALEFLGTLEGWDGGVLWMIAEGESQKIRPRAIWLAEPELREKFATRLGALQFDYGHGVPGRTWATGEVVWIADILEESAMQRAELLATSGLHSVVATPLVDSDRTIGVLEFFTQAVRPLSERRKRTLVRIGLALGRLITRRRMEDDRRWLLALVQRRSDEWMLTFDAIMLPIFLVARDGTIVRLNRAARDLAGEEQYDSLIGCSLSKVAEGEPWGTLAESASAVFDSGVPLSAQITAGETTWDVTCTLLWASENTEQRVVVVLRDLTQVLSLQDAVRRGEQLAALGELVAGVAHEVKNPIFGMTATVEVLLERCSEDAEQAELLEALRMWLARLNGLTENLLEYGRTWTVNLAPGTVGDVIRQAAKSCASGAANAGVTLVLPSGPDPSILMDSTRLLHVFENLILNAVQFSPRGETVTITSELQGDQISYSVSDRGPGFPPADLSRVFQPFFTRRRGGTGLGLSIVQRVIDEHGGTVAAANRSEGGAVVTVRFPIYDPPVRP